MGLTLFSLSVPLKDTKMALIGRALFGIGAEAQNVWLATVISIWFHFGEMAFATALLTCFGKFGSIASSQITPYTFNEWGSIGGSFWIAMIINSIAFIVALLINSIDKENLEKRK